MARICPTWTTVRQAIHLAFWGQVGTMIRIYLGRILGGACKGGSNGPYDFTACLSADGTSAGSAFFVDLPANMLGSFLIALFCHPKHLALALEDDTPHFAVLGGMHPWQTNAALATGLRTGLCGCLTTFASWLLQMVRMLCGGDGTGRGSQPVEVVAGLLMGVLLPMASLVAAEHLVQAVARGKGFVVRKAAMVSSATQTEGDGGGDATEARGGWERNGAGLGSEGPGTPTPTEASAAAAAAGQEKGVKAAELRLPCGAVGVAGDQGLREVLRGKTDAAVLLGLLLLNALMLALTVLDPADSRYASRAIWMSVLLSSPGTLMRWQLSELNAAAWQSKHVPWMRTGTFAANTLACAFDFAISAVLEQARGLTQLQVAALNAAVTGFGGSLSTVSTWMLEARVLLRSGNAPRNRGGGYLYISATVLTNLLLGVAIYGWSVW